MKILIIYIILMVGALTLSMPSAAQVSPESEQFRDSLHKHIWVEGAAGLECRLNYLQGSSTIHTDLEGNYGELQKLDIFLRTATTHPDLFIERIRLTGYCSIEGAYHLNEQLARQRVEGFYIYLREHYPELYRYPHDLAWVAEDWDGLANQVKASVLNEREEVLEIIRKIRAYDTREQLLLKLNGGRAYHEIERGMLPKLRRVEIKIEYGTVPYLNTASSHPIKENKAPDTPAEPGIVVEPISNESPLPSSSAREKKKIESKDIENWLGFERTARNKNTSADSQENTYQHKNLQTVVNSNSGSNKTKEWDNASNPRFALKTNVLLWFGVQHNFKHIAPVANAALEYYLTDRWSVEIAAMYSYWRFNSNLEFQGVSGYRLEPRFSYPVVGDKLDVYLGLYGRVGDYDRSLTPALSQGEGGENYTGDYWDAGLSAGVTFHLIGGLGLEVGARAGYIHTNAIRYTEDGRYNWYHSRKGYNKFKVTDLNVSLIYRFR